MHSFPLKTQSGLGGLSPYLLHSRVSGAAGNVLVPQLFFSLYFTGVLFWHRNINQPFQKHILRLKKVERRSPRVSVSAAKQLEQGRWKLPSWERCPTAIFGFFTGRGKSKVQIRVLCFLLSHIGTTFPSKENVDQRK